MPYRDFSLRKILVATDFSKNATPALRQAVYLADRTKAEVILVHVIADVASAVEGTSFEAHWRIPPADIQKAERKLRLQTGQRLDEEIAVYRSPGRKLSTETLVGVPFVEIIRTVQKKRADLVVAGTRGLSRLKGFLVGSTSERLVRKCPCPVWIVKAGQKTPPRALLVPLDYSEVSGKSLQLAAFLVGRFDCSLNVLHVLDPSTELADLRLKRRDVRESAAKRLGDFVRANVPGGMAFKELIAVGTPWQRIGVMARRLDIDLIVMGSLGRTGIPGFLIGNTAEKVLRHWDQSLITLKPDGFATPVQSGQ
jgi:universal stress protein E